MRTRAATLGVLAALTLMGAGCGEERTGAPAAARAETSAPPEVVTPPAPPERLDPKLVAGLGDSITAGSPLWDPAPDVRAQIAARTGMEPDEESQWGHWYEQAHPGMKVRNCGVFGERTDEIAARLETCEQGAGTLVVQGGINDIAQGRPAAEAARDLEAMVARGKADGRAVVLVEVLPWNNGYPQAAGPISELNGLIRAIGRRRDVPVLPWFGALEDPRRKGRMRADLTIDGDHPSVAGYRRLAALVKRSAPKG